MFAPLDSERGRDGGFHSRNYRYRSAVRQSLYRGRAKTDSRFRHDSFFDVSDLNTSVGLKKVDSVALGALGGRADDDVTLPSAIISEEAAIPRKSENAGINCAGRLADSSLLVINTLQNRRLAATRSARKKEDVRLCTRSFRHP